ncbi:MAG: hypothetical protein HOP29_10725 [Phycisphaerales bacterium]|nr:hypothetical protein [Phycisphaerales bacterium]
MHVNRRRRFRLILTILCGSTLPQLGGCVAAVVPAALAIGEQVFFQRLLAQLGLF